MGWDDVERENAYRNEIPIWQQHSLKRQFVRITMFSVLLSLSSINLSAKFRIEFSFLSLFDFCRVDLGLCLLFVLCFFWLTDA